MVATPQQRALVQRCRQDGLDKDLPAIAIQATLLDGYDPDDDKALLEPCVLLRPIIHPVTAAFLATAGANWVGGAGTSMTMSVGFGEDNYTHAPLRVLFENVRAGAVWPESMTATTKGPRDLTALPRPGDKYNRFRTNFGGTPAFTYIDRNGMYNELVAPMPADDEHRFGGFAVKASDRQLYIKAFTHKLEVPAHLPQVRLDLRTGDFTKAPVEPRPILATHATAVLEWLASEGVFIDDPDPAGPIARLRKRIASAVIAYPTPGRPAMADVSVGSRARAFLDEDDLLGAPAPGDGVAATRGQALAQHVEAVLRAKPFLDGVLHPGTRDAGRLALAEPFDGDDRLKPYQRIAVGRHLATGIGMLNASSPGMGKTVMTLVGMRERAKKIRGYRGLIVLEANVRHQWGPEAEKWFPAAKVVTIDSASKATLLRQELATAGDRPLLVICSYALLGHVFKEMVARAEQTAEGQAAEKATGIPETLFTDALGQLALFSLDGDDLLTLGGTVEDDEPVEEGPVTLGPPLLDTFWHDLIADEAEVLRSTGTKQGAALWQLRSNAEVAIPLTGTPVNRNIDDLGRLVAWARGDERLFRGVKLSEQFDLTDPDSLAEYQRSMGAVVFRADASEVSDEMPDIDATVIKLKPSAAEKALADAARMELKRVYEELVEAIDRAEALDEENPAFREAREALRAARGAHLGGTTLARMASSDPAALLGSTSAGAALLAGQGLIEAATQQTGTKRAAMVAKTVDWVRHGEAVLIFTEFATVARGLIDDLEASGTKVGAVLGGGGKKRDEMIVAFQRGDLDVLVLTSSGERGLNLQRASVVVHYDLPWAPKGVLQRTGRALRLESTNQRVKLVFPLMEGTVEERVAATVVRRALEAMYALDKSRGVDISKTEIGLALGGLAESLHDTAEGRSHGNEMMDITRMLVG